MAIVITVERSIACSPGHAKSVKAHSPCHDVHALPTYDPRLSPEPPILIDPEFLQLDGERHLRRCVLGDAQRPDDTITASPGLISQNGAHEGVCVPQPATAGG